MKNNLYLIGALLLSFIVSSCTPKVIPPEPAFTPYDYSAMVKRGEYQKKVDNFLVIFDASSSMKMNYKDEMKFRLAKRIANNMNLTIPELEMVAGTHLFGPTPYNLWSGDIDLLYGMTQYTQAGFANSLATVTTTGGGTPMDLAIAAATRELSGTKGNIAVIVISDAEDIGDESVNAAALLKSKYKDRICIYTILIGDKPGSKEIMDGIAAAGGCGYSTDYERLSTPSGMADFVRDVFLKKGVVKKTAPALVRVIKAFPVDSDGDGVFDDKDACPATPRGIKVNDVGCPLPIKKTSIELRVEFDVDKYFIRQQYGQTLKEFADFLNNYPNLHVLLEGHTDNTGTEAYNQKLSERRAASVKQYLVTYFRINSRRITTKGYNFSKPESNNMTDAGRQRNRRVYATLTAR